jgi:hypothetical protein
MQENTSQCMRLFNVDRPTDPNFEDHAIGNTHTFFGQKNTLDLWGQCGIYLITSH